MQNKVLICLVTAVIATLALGCSSKTAGPVISSQPGQNQPPLEPRALPTNGFKAQITLVEPPEKLRSGQKETVRIKVKNDSEVMWWARGAPVNNNPNNKYYIAVGNRWLKPDGTLVTNMDGRYGISKDLKPGEATEVPLLITAPKDPGDYTLEIDVVQEQVAWFSEKGSPTAKVKITVVK
jgi:hypothetical protein